MEKFMLIKFADRPEEAFINLQKVEAIFRTVSKDGVVELEIHYTSGGTSTYYNKEAEAIRLAFQRACGKDVWPEANIIEVDC